MFLNKVSLISLTCVLFVLALGLIVLSIQSQKGTAPGLVDGRLAPCPDKPNVVSSEAAIDSDHYVEPLPWRGDSAQAALDAVERTLESLGGQVVSTEGFYRAATFTSTVFRFVDDVELRADEEAQVIHIRSASRVGHSDLGANRKRVERIRKALAD